jgi:magnesium chelatase family protein
LTLAIVHSRTLRGLEAPAVTVEVHLANGLPSFTLVGLADTEVKEARERVRAALQTSGLEFPHNKRVTVNLAPADLPKESGRFDLPIALGILAAAGHIDAARLEAFEFAGELSLGGELRPVPGALAMALALHRAPGGSARTLVLPRPSADESALVPGLSIRGADHLLGVVKALLPGDAADASELYLAAPPTRAEAPAVPDLIEVKGQAAAKRALEVAAAGGLSLLMSGTLDPTHERCEIEGLLLPPLLYSGADARRLIPPPDFDGPGVRHAARPDPGRGTDLPGPRSVCVPWCELGSRQAR